MARCRGRRLQRHGRDRAPGTADASGRPRDRPRASHAPKPPLPGALRIARGRLAPPVPAAPKDVEARRAACPGDVDRRSDRARRSASARRGNRDPRGAGARSNPASSDHRAEAAQSCGHHPARDEAGQATRRQCAAAEHGSNTKGRSISATYLGSVHRRLSLPRSAPPIRLRDTATGRASYRRYPVTGVSRCAGPFDPSRSRSSSP
jgi:hypothetical protein